jgi:hypothetical protein
MLMISWLEKRKLTWWPQSDGWRRESSPGGHNQMVGEEKAHLVVTIRWLEKRKHCRMASRSCFTTESRPLVPPLFFSGTTFQNKLRSADQDHTEVNENESFHYLYESTLADKHLVHVQENVASFHDHSLNGQVFPEKKYSV